MSKIIHLDKILSNQIAAWEVVERPASIVKELVENSIDAWASNIKIEIKNWWADEIIITDNGSGIEKDYLALSVEKYSTSKIKSLEDLYNVMTFWFRWEALASVSSVSKFLIISKISDSESSSEWQRGWYALEVVDGEASDIREYPSENGTKVIVKNLFYNTPARLNYLKKPRTEYSKILEFLNAISLSYPSVWFEFINDDKKVFKYSKGEDLKTRVYNIYWEEFSSNLLEINFELVGIKISGYISDPKVSFPNKNRQSLFVNHRVIKSPLIFRSINNAYNRFIPHNLSPAYILNIDVDPTQVDVNVHPRKLEVRFAEESQIFRWVYHAIEQKLTWVSLVSSPNLSPEVEGSRVWESSYYTGSWTKFKSYSPYKDTAANPAQWKIYDAIKFSRSVIVGLDPTIQWVDPRVKHEDDNTEFEQSTDLHDTALGKIIWQSHNSYIIVETTSWIKFLDQHALAERVIYERLVKEKTSFKTQGLLIWESLNLSSKELDILEGNKKVFEDMWFDFEIMWGWIVMINWIPDFIKKEKLSDIFLWVLDDIWGYSFSKSKTLDEVKNKIFAYMSCRSAIKFWNKLNLFEMNKLLNDSVLDYSATCPHGRPVVFDIGLNELKDKYER